MPNLKLKIILIGNKQISVSQILFVRIPEFHEDVTSVL